jgi:hypothetical protein
MTQPYWFLPAGAFSEAGPPVSCRALASSAARLQAHLQSGAFDLACAHHVSQGYPQAAGGKDTDCFGAGHARSDHRDEGCEQ